MARMTQNDFVALLSTKGIYIGKIGSKYVEVLSLDGQRLGDWTRLPNCYNDMPIFGEWSYKRPSDDKEETLLDIIRAGQLNPSSRWPFHYIHAIKIVREKSGMGLKEAKEVVEANADDWAAFPEIELIKRTPRKELVKILPTLENSRAITYLESILKGTQEHKL